MSLCLRCKILGCEMVPAGFAYDYDDSDDGIYRPPSFSPRPTHAISACTRCGHYSESAVCGGRRDGKPPLWKRFPSFVRKPTEWWFVHWWRGQLWIARGATPLAALRQARDFHRREAPR